jgi:hypothetical protein
MAAARFQPSAFSGQLPNNTGSMSGVLKLQILFSAKVTLAELSSSAKQCGGMHKASVDSLSMPSMQNAEKFCPQNSID